MDALTPRVNPVVAFLPGGSEWALVLVLVILFFGAAKIPELARSLGRAKGEFQRGAREGTDAPAAKKEERTFEAAEEERIRKAARELGIPVEGRSVSDIKADLRAKMG